MSNEQIDFYMKAQKQLEYAFANVRPTDELMETCYEACVLADIEVDADD